MLYSLIFCDMKKKSCLCVWLYRSVIGILAKFEPANCQKHLGENNSIYPRYKLQYVCSPCHILCLSIIFVAFFSQKREILVNFLSGNCQNLFGECIFTWLRQYLCLVCSIGHRILCLGPILFGFPVKNVKYWYFSLHKVFQALQ